MIFYCYMTGYKTYKKKWMAVTCKDNLDHSGETQKGTSKENLFRDAIPHIGTFILNTTIYTQFSRIEQNLFLW